MPNIKSAIKRVKTSEIRRLRNIAVKTDLKIAIKKVEHAVAQQDKENVKTYLQIATKKLDKAASKGVIHKNKAARKKSRLMSKVNKLLA
ncbi:ribosomal protein S20 (BS20) [[Clostridium] ultunense Esp]|uniref:30S ribosomal protein S20 n=1 Tax=Thermicanus aegyptius TaxID=94009 RepID=UPI0002B6F791|nr:30S ribosomal protein S20 [Thermicanus aegyptius]CCQ94273.1 ribosomal protein S20 (BS20) [[Clostridium] ultunense Esp]